MPDAPAAAPNLDTYQLRLPVYEGPLDLLLRLIEREQLAVSEVSLLAVFDQFMTFFRNLESPSPEVIAEFASVAGRLSVLKSRALLPKPPMTEEDAAEPDFVQQLEEYRMLKLAAQHLADRHRAGTGGFGRGESIARPLPEPPRYAPQPSATLARAVERWLSRLPSKPVEFAVRRVVSLREMITRIFTALEDDRRISFDTVRESCLSRQDVAVAFLAMLTLVRRQAIVVSQATLFGPIMLARPDPARAIQPRVELSRVERVDPEDLSKH